MERQIILQTSQIPCRGGLSSYTKSIHTMNQGNHLMIVIYIWQHFPVS